MDFTSLISKVTHAAWQRSLQASQWETLVKSAATKENIPLESLPSEILLSLLPHLITPSHPSPLHLSYLTHSLLLTHPPLIPPLALLSALLSSTTTTIPLHLTSLLLASIPFPLPLNNRLSSSQTFVFLPLLATAEEGDDSFLKLAPRVMAAPILDDADEGGANQHHLGVEAVLLSLAGKTGEDAEFVRGVLQSYIVLGGGGAATMHSGDEVDRTVMMLLAGDGTGDVGGGENALEGLVDTSGMEGVLDLAVAGGGEGLVDASLAGEAEDATAGADGKMGDLLLISLTSQPSTSTLSILRAALTQLAPSPTHSHPVLLLSLYTSILSSIAAGSSTRAFGLCILPPILTSLPLSPTDAAWLLQSLFISSSSPSLVLDQIDALENAKRETKRRPSAVLAGDDDGSNAMDLMGGGGDFLGWDEGASASEKARHPPIRQDLIERFLEVGLIDEEVAKELGLEEQRRPRVETDGRDIEQYYADVLASESTVEELTRVFTAASVDYDALPVLASTFMEKWTSWTSDLKDLDSLNTFASFFLSTPAAISHLDTIFEMVDDGPRKIVSEGIWFLEEFVSDGYGDTQGILVQYGQVALFLQIVIRGYDLTCTDLGQVNGRAITTDIFRSSSIVLPLSSLNEEDRTLVGGWIGALNGSEGIPDDLLRSTPPRTLLRLSSTVISQSIMASQRQIIDSETLSNGISFFFQPLLSWCLVGILEWLVREIRRLGLYSASHLQILQLLVMGSSCPPTVLLLARGSILRLFQTETGLDLVMRQGGGSTGHEVKAKVMEAKGPTPPSSTTTTTWETSLHLTIRHLLSPSSSSPPTLSLQLHHLPPTKLLHIIFAELLSFSPTPPTNLPLLHRAVALIALPLGKESTSSSLVKTFLYKFIIDANPTPGSRAEGLLKELVGGVRRLVEEMEVGGGKSKVVGMARREVDSLIGKKGRKVVGRGGNAAEKGAEWIRSLAEVLKEEKHLGEGLVDPL